jgi:predicted secreted protein
MILGILSVTTATSQQYAIGMLNTPLAIRLYLSSGQPVPNRYLDTELNHQPFNIIPLESSLAAIKLNSLPRRHLQGAVFLFVIGILLFYLLLWLQNPVFDNSTSSSTTPSSPNSSLQSRNIFLTALLTTVVLLTYQFLWSLLHLRDSRKWTTEFDLRSRGSYEQPYYLEKLKRDLQRVQNLAAEMEREQMVVYAKERGLTVDELVENLNKRKSAEGDGLGKMGRMVSLRDKGVGTSEQGRWSREYA